LRDFSEHENDGSKSNHEAMDVCVQRCGVLIHNMFVGSGSKTTSLYATMLCFLKDYSNHVLCQSVDRQYPIPLQHTSKTMTQRDRLHYGISCAVQVDRKNQGERDEDEQLESTSSHPPYDVSNTFNWLLIGEREDKFEAITIHYCQFKSG
jgi:hypothetical protein